MKVEFIGKLNIDAVAKKMLEIADSTIERVNAESEGDVITGFELHDAEFTLKFKVEGMDEPQLLTVEHHQGHPEIFKWIVDMDNEKDSTNEEESEFDAWTVAKAKGEELAFEEIESIYDTTEMTLLSDLTEDYGSMSKFIYEHPEGFRVVQVYQDRKIIQEYKLIPKEDAMSA